jgi:homoserine dehydrogenase
LGTVGTGVARILLEHADRVARHAGRPLELRAVVVRDCHKKRQLELPPGLVTDDLDRVLRNPEIQLVAQLIGGLDPARSIMMQLLQAGKDVVTANKALLADYGPELFQQARRLGRSIAFEASVAGGVPIVVNISQCLSANQITSLRGILNGTTNFIITQMEEHGLPYDQGLLEAQRRGYAEADPTMDVDGSDAAQKLAILAQLAYGSTVNWRAIPRVGITSLDPIDLQWARELGYRVKLLAVARLENDELEMHVSPTLVKAGTPLAEVRDAYNAITVVGDMVGRVFYHGLGAGQNPTASAVVADMIDMATGRAPITFRLLEMGSDKRPPVPVSDHAHVIGRYYLRLTVDDHPGVLARIATVLGEHGISIASVIQHELDDAPPGGGASLVIMTHETTEGAMEGAVDRIDRLDVVLRPSVRIRVLD